MLETCELVKEYVSAAGERVRAVDGVELRVARGELVVLHGPSGSGKSTLLELIAAAEPPDSGRIVVDELELTAPPQPAPWWRWRQRRLQQAVEARIDDYRLKTVGVVPESPYLIDGLTAIDHAALRLTEQGLSWPDAHRQVKPLLDRLELARRVDRQAAELSKGERARVSLAMALATTPSLVLADEPTANLDSRLVQDVLALLRDYSREQHAAVLLVTHDPAARPYGDRVVQMRDGRIVADAAPATVTEPASAERA